MVGTRNGVTMAKRTYAKKPLYRKVNRRTHGVRPGHGGEARWHRNTKTEAAEIAHGATRKGMRQGLQHGLDYGPLFRFLLSKVGEDWDAVYAEAVSRLPSEEPIFWIVARSERDMRDVICVGEGTLFSGLYVDGDNRLARVAPDIGIEDIEPYCPCHTHSFNGEVVTNPCRNPQFGDGDPKEPWAGFVRAKGAGD